MSLVGAFGAIVAGLLLGWIGYGGLALVVASPGRRGRARTARPKRERSPPEALGRALRARACGEIPLVVEDVKSEPRPPSRALRPSRPRR